MTFDADAMMASGTGTLAEVSLQLAQILEVMRQADSRFAAPIFNSDRKSKRPVDLTRGVEDVAQEITDIFVYYKAGDKVFYKGLRQQRGEHQTDFGYSFLWMYQLSDIDLWFSCRLGTDQINYICLFGTDIRNVFTYREVEKLFFIFCRFRDVNHVLLRPLHIPEYFNIFNRAPFALGVRNYFADSSGIALPAKVPNFTYETVPGGKLLTVDMPIEADAVQIPEEVIEVLMATMQEMGGNYKH